MSQVRPLLSPLLVGRDELLALADRRLDEAMAGNGHLLLLAGEAGIGKTRLVGAVLRKAETAGYRVAKGDLAPHDGLVPLASVLDLARTMRDGPTSGRSDRCCLHGRRGRGLPRLAPDARPGDRRPHPRGDRPSDGARLRGPPVGRRAQPRGDRRARTRSGATCPLLLLGAYRLDELPAGSIHREWRARLISQRLAEEVRLEPLTQDETALVIDAHPGDRPAGAARGRRAPCTSAPTAFPCTSRSCSPRWTTRPGPDGRAIRAAQVPDTIEDAVLARVMRLSDDAHAVARAGAVIGRCFVPEVLAGCMDRPVADLEAPLAELVEQSFLYPFDFLDHGYYDFRHQLLRDALYATVGPSELRHLHARAAEFGSLLVGSSEIHASVHFERAGLRDAGVPDGAGRRARRECRLESARGVRALPARRGERARRAPGCGARRPVRGLLRGGPRDRQRAA